MYKQAALTDKRACRLGYEAHIYNIFKKARARVDPDKKANHFYIARSFSDDDDDDAMAVFARSSRIAWVVSRSGYEI